MNIIVTLTTVPNRLLEHHGSCSARLAITTLLEQSYQSYEVHFNIPLYYRNNPIILPEWIDEYAKKYNHLKVFRTDDYGPITKIFPTLERVTDLETMIIVADDDLYYMDGMISSHVEARSRYPEAALGFAGLSSIDGSCHFCTTIQKDTRVKILEGYKTVSYLRKFFDTEELKSQFMDKSWRDDETLSAYMGYKNIPKIVLAYSGDTDYNPRVESFPVIGHVPTQQGGCHVFRNCDEAQKRSDDNIQKFYKLGYLER